MARFVFKFLCIFYAIVVANTRTLYSNADNCGKLGDIFGFRSRNDPTELKNNDKREAKVINNDIIEKILANVTEKVNFLKKEYASERYKTLFPKLDNINDYSTQKPTKGKTTIAVTEEVDFLGTAQIEKLLNDIKARAIKMVAEQNPAVTDIITNTVTEATFEADPILTHLEMSSPPGYALTTFVCLNNVENIDKRTANDSKVILISNRDSKHNVSARSVKEDAYTIAHNVEDMLQKELKSIYKKVKNKVSKDFHKEVKKAKSTMKCESSKIINKVTKKVTAAAKTSHLTAHRKATTASRHNRGNKSTKQMKKSTKQMVNIITTPTVDDFAMLTLYEQILAKTHEDNVMKLLTTNKKRKVDGTIRLSKRNPETLADLTLKENVKRMYDYGEGIPDVDYNDDIIIPEASNDYSTDTNTNPKTTKYYETTYTTEGAPVEETSYEGLSDKISYKDYVNGYKSYLKFQKDQANQNFSALVKYQAHRHHKVDDIGKFILNKIPQIPNRKRRHFFDDGDIDDQDISTKSDDSWFKKHFYMFVDSGPPKKYHTSETVEFKDVTEASSFISYTDSRERPGLRVSGGQEVRGISEVAEGTADINLDELSKVLEDCKATASGIPQLNNDNSIDTTPVSKQDKIEDNGVGFKVYAPNIMSKLFGKGRRNPTKNRQNYDDNTLKHDEDLQFLNFILNSDLERPRRNAKKHVKNIKNKVNKKLTPTTLNKQDNANFDKTKSNSEKVGCVSIVTQPTAIVNLHKTAVKGSKIKKLLSKLHFHKRNKKKMKEKRHCTRVQRFNPLKRLRNMFMPRPEVRATTLDDKLPADYDMLTSHIDTFKPVKYDKIPSIDELKNLVPNISSDVAPSQLGEMDVDNEVSDKDYTKKKNKVMADVDRNVATKSYSDLSNSQSVQPTTKKISKSIYSTQKISINEMLKDALDVTDDVMNVNVKTVPKDGIPTISPATRLDGLGDVLDTLQKKLSPEDTLKASPTSQTFNMKEKKYESMNSADDDITINAKLTKIAKYPLSKPNLKYNNTEIHSVRDNTKFYEFVKGDGYGSVHDELYPNSGSEKRTPFFEIHSTTDKSKDLSTINKGKVKSSTPLLEITVRNSESVKEVHNDALSYKRYPDYFHDFVMWNSDILNTDKVSNPTWQDILKDIQKVEFTTPNINNIENELNEIDENIINNYIYQKDNKNRITFKETSEPNSYVLSSPRYIEKPDNIKVTVDNNKMEINPTFEDFDKNSHYFLRNDIKKYGNVKSQNIIDVLNKLYTNNPYEVKTRANTLRATGKCNNNNANNSLMKSKHKKKETHTKAKVNKQPKQYYNTPMPMKNNQFEKFLKENQLDVESLTLPFNEMSRVTQTWHSKMSPPTINSNRETSYKGNTIKSKDNIKETTKVGNSKGIDEGIDKSYPDNHIEYFNGLDQNLYNEYRNNVNIRQKKSSVPDYDTFTDNALVGKEKIDKFKNRFNDMFDNMKPNGFTEKINLNSVSYPNENEVEITIINFNDTDKKYYDTSLVTNPNEKVSFNVNPTVNDDTKTLTSVDSSDLTKIQKVTSKAEKETEQFQDQNHLIKEDVSKIDFKNDAQKNLKGLEEKNNNPNLEDELSSMNRMQLHANTLGEKYKNKQGNLPKRVRISSHSYKYDVFYNVPNKSKAAVEQTNNDDKRDTDIKGLGDYIENDCTKSEINQIIIVVDVVKAVDDYTRPDIPIHINLPTYYAPNTNADNTELLPVNLKTSWTDVVLKYISGIALIEMLNKLGILKGINLTDGLNLNFDRDKVFNKDGVMDHERKLRVERGAKTTKKRHTFSQTIHFTREMKRPRNKRLFKLLLNKLMLFSKNNTTISTMKTSTTKKLPTKSLKVIDKLKLFAINKNTISTMKFAETKDLSTKSLKNFATTTLKTTNETVATKIEKCTKRNVRDSEESNDNSLNIYDYKGDIDEKNNGNIKTTDLNLSQSDTKNKDKYYIDKEGVQVEVAEYNDRIYDKTVNKADGAAKYTQAHTSQVYIKENSETNKDLKTFSKLKRDVSHKTFTAKDVAVLEVVVDLMKNTVSYGEKSHKNFITAPTKPRKNTNDKIEQVTNSIQVHIAIPYDMPDKKRSLDPLKVRKVFIAKLATPVDLEYQIQSIEDSATATITVNPDLDYGISTGMYLLVDDVNTMKGSFALRPVKPPLEQMIKADDVTEKLDDQTKADNVTLSKEFVAAVNKHLIQLYENIKATNAKSKHKVTRREISWDRVKNYFGHDRACSCKCKENKTMCRACAASDAVINELTFEFDNLAKYMSDHCTEIQTFFRMNPSGGRVLRDSVHKIDKSLNDYYKRVKGKCRGRTCKAFATYIDKRDFGKDKKMARTYIGEYLINDLKSLNDNFDTLSYFIPYNETLKEKGDQLVMTAESCIASMPISKRSSFPNHIKKRYDKEVYTLENISVNIICSPEASSESYSTSPLSIFETQVSKDKNIYLDYDNKRNCKKNKLKNLFGKKNKHQLSKLFTYYETHVTVADHFKREAKYDQVEPPLIADTGGSFWLDYLSKGNVDVNDNTKPNIQMSVEQNNTDETPDTTASVQSTESFKDKVKNMCKSIIKATASTAQSQFVTDAPTDSLSYNINELFKLVGTVTDIEELKDTFTNATTVACKNNTTKHKTKKIKTKKRKNIHKSTKAKVHRKHKIKSTKMTTDIPTNTCNTTSTINTNINTAMNITTEVPKTTEPVLDALSQDETTATVNTNTQTEQARGSTTTKTNLFNKIKMATIGFLSNIGKGKFVLDLKTTKAATCEDHQTTTANNNNIKPSATDDNKYGKDDLNVISKGTTTEMNDIIIINEQSTMNALTKNSKYKSILLSLLNYESGKLDKERQMINYGFEKEIDAGLVENYTPDDVDEIANKLMGLKMQPKKSSKASHRDKDYDIVKSLENIGTDLELPAPPGLQSQPGTLERIAHQFGIKVVQEAAAKPVSKFAKHLRVSKRRLTGFEEAEPSKVQNFDAQNNRRSDSDRKILFEDHTSRLQETDRIEGTLSQKASMKNAKITHRLAEFDSYIREDNSIYRLKRNDSFDTTSTRVTAYIRSRSAAVPEARKITNYGHRKQRKQKRSSAGGIRNGRIALQLQHATGYFVATVTCFYIVFALLAMLVNWLFRR